MTKSWHENFKRAPLIERTDRNGLVFDSKTELQRWEYLKLLQRAGDIVNLQRQIKFELRGRGVTVKCGHDLGAEVAVYTADFSYIQNADSAETVEIIEDVKGYRDEASKFRIRVFEAIHGKRVRIVTKKRDGRWVTE